MSFELPKKEIALEELEKKFADKREITLKDLKEMKERGITTEKFLNYLGAKYNYLFHGSRSKLSLDEKLKSSWWKEIFASDNPAI